MNLQFTVPGNPVPKARPRFRIVKPKGKESFVSTYTDSATVEQEKRVSDYAKRAMGSRFPTSAPVEVMIELRMRIPPSWSKKKQVAAVAGQVRATNKPDVDNLAKLLADACNAIVWADDSQIVTLTVRKLYHIEPCAIVAVRVVEGESA